MIISNNSISYKINKFIIAYKINKYIIAYKISKYIIASKSISILLLQNQQVHYHYKINKYIITTKWGTRCARNKLKQNIHRQIQSDKILKLNVYYRQVVK